MIDSATRSFVEDRASDRCEYCQLPQSAYEATFCIDHIQATQHARNDSAENLALCCPRRNRKKGPNLSSIDPDTQLVTTLFHPRRGGWSDHFRWNGPLAVGITSVGRATASLLDLNHEDRLRLRASLIAEGVFP